MFARHNPLLLILVSVILTVKHVAIATMATKSRSAGTISWTPPRFTCKYYRGSTLYYEYAKGPSSDRTYQRRIGQHSQITTFNGGDGRMRPCSHKTVNYEATPPNGLNPDLRGTFPGGPAYQYVSSAVCQNLCAYVHGLRYGQFLTVADQPLPTYTVDWSGLSANAVGAMLPSFTGPTNLVNFILELKDFKNVISAIGGRSGSTGFNRAREVLAQAGGGIDRRRTTFENLSRGKLAYSFGWAPLCRDVQKIWSDLHNLHRRMQNMVSRLHRPQQRYWGQWIAGTEDGTTVLYHNGAGDGPYLSSEGVWAPKVGVQVLGQKSQGYRYHATIRYHYECPELLTATGRTKALLDTLGINGNPATIWNAIPFSFIVDWIVNVNGYLQRLRVDNLHIKTTITDFCHSVKYQRRYTYELQPMHIVNGGISPGATILADAATKTVYERRLGLPNFLLALQTSGLSFNEVTLAGALIGAKAGGFQHKTLKL